LADQLLDSLPRVVVLDTNIVLDVWVFSDPKIEPLRTALQTKQLRWLATLPMREELARVLTYPKIVQRLSHGEQQADAVLAQFDTLVQLAEVPRKAGVTCRDPDDQKFIDLAVAHKALILSKDNAVLCMKKRLLAHGASVLTAI
jgi:putative PIN family toxin of toxin-antitoxin system